MALAVVGWLVVRDIGLLALWLWFEARPITRPVDAGGSSANEWLGLSWDSWYLRDIADRGYDGGTAHEGFGMNSNLAFFPLFPLAARAVGAVSGLGFVTAGQLTAWLGGAIAAAGIFAVAHALTVARAGERLALRAGVIAAVLWGANPFAIVESKAYTESVFMAVAAWALYAGLTRRWLLLGALTAVSGLARAQAVLVVLFTWAAIGPALWRARGRDWRAWTGAGLAPLGFIGWNAYCAATTGDPLGWIGVEKAWGRANTGPWESVTSYARELLNGSFLAGGWGQGALLILGPLWFAICLGLGVWCVAARQPFAIQVWNWATFALVVYSADEGNRPVIGRFLLPAFTLFIPLALRLARSRGRVVILVLGAAALVSAFFGNYLAHSWGWWV
jgi:hypothetical protein